MRKTLGLFVVLLALGFAAETVTFDANWASNPLFNVVNETPFGIELVFSSHQMVIEEQVLDGVVHKSFGVPSVFIAEPGRPNLAGATRYVAVPQGARVQVVILDVRTEVYHDIEVAPASNIPRDNDDAPLYYEKDMAIYSRNAYWPSSPVTVSAPMKMRGVDVVLVGVMPFQYNPVTKELIVYKDLRFRVDFIGGTGHFGVDRLRSRFWEPILRGHLLNYGSLPKIDFYAAQPTEQSGFEYIIIVPDDALFETWGDTIKAWRKLQGISCDVFTLTEIGGSSATDIENFLNNAYATWDPAPVAFLILSDYPSSGDVYGVTSPFVDGYPSDNKYADVDGDTLPDMFHGRITAQTATHLDRMVNKFLSYERSPYTDAGFYDHPLVACGYQTERWFQLCSETVRHFMINEFGKDPARQYNIYSGSPSPGSVWSSRTGTAPVVQYWYDQGWLPSLTNPYTSAWWDSGSSAGITAAINAGCFFIQHRDHGSLTGWGEPVYNMGHLDDLTNTMYPFLHSINCLTGSYQNASEVFCEKFHRIEHGVLGFNAPSAISYSFVNDTYVWGTYDGLWSQFDPGYPFFDMAGYANLRPGMAMVSAKYYLFASWMPDSAGLGMSYKVTTAQLFHIHGDVFLTMYSQIPLTLTVSHAASLTAGATTFTVTANDSSVIALTVNGEIIGVAEGTGSPVPITIPPQSPGNTMKVTVTKADYYRYEVDVPITSSTYPYVTLSGTLIDDSAGNNDGVVNPGETIDYGIYGKNVGTGTALSVYGLLSEIDTYVTLSVDSSWYGDIPEDDSSLSSPYYTFAVATDCPNGHVVNFTLDFHDVNDSIFTSFPTVTVYAPVLTFVDVAVVNDPNANGILDPGEDADLVVTIENEGGATASSITSTLWTSSPYITINDASGNYGSIDPGNQGNNSADPYNVTASGTTPTGTVCDFEVEVVSGIYVDTLQFSLVVGKKHYYLWNPDPSPSSGLLIDSILAVLGYSGDYGTTLVSDLSMYQACLVTTGVYANRYLFPAGSAQAAQLVDFLQNDDGRVYMEGSATWYIDPFFFSGYDFRSVFGMTATAYSYQDMGPIAGESGTFTTGMSFTYAGENSYMDHINPTGTGFLIFHDTDNAYNCGVANDASTYRTVGVSFELIGLVDATPPSTREALIDSIMKFFGIIIPGVEEEGGITNIPLKTMLSALYPNPGVRVMNIRYQVAHLADVSLRLYDATGRLVRTFAQGACEPGYYTMIWNTRDDSGRAVPAGVYFLRFETDDYQKTEKAILLR